MRQQQAPPEFYDKDGIPRWNEIALFCQKNSEQLTAWEQKFSNDMAGHTLCAMPSPKQATHLLKILSS